MYCSKCGNEVSVEAKFCGICGNATEVSAADDAFGRDTSDIKENEVQTKLYKKNPSGLKQVKIGLAVLGALVALIVLVAVICNSDASESTSYNGYIQYGDTESTVSSENSSGFEVESNDVIDTEIQTSSEASKKSSVIESSSKASVNPSSSAPSSKTSTVKSAEPEDIPFNYDDITEAIRAYNCYDDCGLACSHYVDEKDYIGELWGLLSEQQKEWASSIYKLDCCNSVAEAKAHYDKYLSTYFRKENPFDTKNLIETNGKLYCVCGAKGRVEYGFARPDLPIRRSAYNKLYVNVEVYLSADVLNFVTVNLEYQDGLYKIVNVE